MTRTLATALLATLILAGCTLPSKACEPDPSGMFCEGTRQDWFGERPKPKPQVKGWSAVKPKPRLTGDVDPQVCVATVSTGGDEARTEDDARLQAVQHWLKLVRWDYGEKYLSIERAKDVLIACSRSDFPKTGGKVGAVLDATGAVTHYRCKITGKPCAAQFEPMAREDK